MCTSVLSVIAGQLNYGPHVVHESASWRVPLAIQVIPAVVLALGCLILPPSPRLLIFQGKHGDALNALHRLRLRQVEGGDTEMLVKVCIHIR